LGPKRIYTMHKPVSALGQKRTYAPLFDHLRRLNVCERCRLGPEADSYTRWVGRHHRPALSKMFQSLLKNSHLTDSPNSSLSSAPQNLQISCAQSFPLRLELHALFFRSASEHVIGKLFVLLLAVHVAAAVLIADVKRPRIVAVFLKTF